jgi:hypothetical protein
MDLASVRAEVASKLPGRCKPLLLTFYGAEARQNGNYIVIGDDEGPELCVDASDGTVLSIDVEGGLPTRFVNSSVDQLARSLEAYLEYAKKVRRARSEVDEAELAAEVQRLIAAVDPLALGDSEHWWAVVLEQAEEGLL